LTDVSRWAKPRSAGGAPCSTRSRHLHESLAATASYGRRWVLLEVASGWGPNAFRDSPALDRALGLRIERRAAAERMRLVAIRRPGRARLGGGRRWRWARVDSTPGDESVTWGEAREPEEYLTAAFDEPGTRSRDLIVAVCAHGRHDQCCATRGRSVAMLLAKRDAESVWECSHIGGDRFAATMLLFPHGITYGWADTLDAQQMVDEYRAGRVVLSGLRGRSAFRFVEQAAQDAARRTTGDLRIDAYEPLSATRTEPGRWQVLLNDRPGPIRVDLAETLTEPLYSNCAATVPLPVPAFSVQAVERLT
jgi:Sucrase/ferredoxin-like